MRDVWHRLPMRGRVALRCCLKLSADCSVGDVIIARIHRPAYSLDRLIRGGWALFTHKCGWRGGAVSCATPMRVWNCSGSPGDGECTCRTAFSRGRSREEAMPPRQPRSLFSRAGCLAFARYPDFAEKRNLPRHWPGTHAWGKSGTPGVRRQRSWLEDGADRRK